MAITSIKEIHQRLIANAGELASWDDEIEFDFSSLDELPNNVDSQSDAKNLKPVDQADAVNLAIVVDNAAKPDEEHCNAQNQKVEPIIRYRKIKRHLFD